MKFTCTRENLNEALSAVSGMVSRAPHLPILANVCLSAGETSVECIGTNLEMAVRATLRARIELAGSFTVPGKVLSDYVHLLSADHVTVEMSGNELSIVCGSASTKIKGTAAEEFPVVPQGDGDVSYSILVEPFLDALSKTVFAAGKNDTRPELSGVYFGFFTERYSGLLLAATDSYRLSEKRVSVAVGDTRHTAIVPSRTGQEIIRLLSTVSNTEGNKESQVRVQFSQNQIFVRYGSWVLVSRLIEGTYPDYSQIIPSSFKTTAVLSLDVLSQHIRAAGLFSTTGVNAVSFRVIPEDNSLTISSMSSQKGEHTTTVEAEVSGEQNSIVLNHKYVLDGIAHIDGDVAFCLNGPDSACVFRPKGREDYLYIVMPVRQ